MTTAIITLPTSNEIEYRCTMPEHYPKGSDGYKDPGARQGYYIYAINEEAAREKMLQRFPRAKAIDAQLWKPGKGAKA